MRNRMFFFCFTYKLIEIFPIILGHQTKSAKHPPAEVIEVSVAVVGVFPGHEARVVGWTLTENISHNYCVHHALHF